ncbi:hypothetical protein KC909_06710, partial [Candidatus Dojkabacteria bacterium]|nr:hypothetical protein [Candidatus Dojkabacteria bacterium]
MRRINISAITTLLMSNLIPILGVIYADWSVFTIMLLYWIESAVIGLLNIPKIYLANNPPPGSMEINGRPVEHVTNRHVIPFFIVHYGIFMAVHLGFVFALFDSSGFKASWVELSIISFLFSHTQSYIKNYVGNKEY